MCSRSVKGQIQLSQSTYELLQHEPDLLFEDGGVKFIKGMRSGFALICFVCILHDLGDILQRIDC